MKKHPNKSSNNAAVFTRELPLNKRIQIASKPQLAQLVLVTFVFYTLADWILPASVTYTVLIAATAYLIRQLLFVFGRWHDEIPMVKRFIWCFLTLLVELVIENFLVWVISSVDDRKMDRQPALQDNVFRMFKSVKWEWFQWFIYYPFGNALKILSWALFLSFSAAWDQHAFSGFGMMARFCLTIAASRVVRTMVDFRFQTYSDS